jgi:hypothetical protein
MQSKSIKKKRAKKSNTTITIDEDKSCVAGKKVVVKAQAKDSNIVFKKPSRCNGCNTLKGSNGKAYNNVSDTEIIIYQNKYCNSKKIKNAANPDRINSAQKLLFVLRKVKVKSLFEK